MNKIILKKLLATFLMSTSFLTGTSAISGFAMPGVNVILKHTDIANETYPDRPIKIDENGYCEVPEGVTKIGEHCFGWCSNLKSIKLPSTLKEIDGMAFSNSGLESIEIPEGVTKIEEDAFFDCTNLKTIIAPANVIKLLKSRNVKLPENVELIESRK